ncbi:MAG: BadF/BadG/BcrA/BcrD ATPase family protein [Anaerolineaceae bacterium]|jgi:N-acetylglucosamine kinase-like BadF-type ATPase|nr:BadF/BadG/BcrA/BcrD ATPase family protein [Anaerolineaceae bacterium]
MQYFLGVDVGGTKTHALLADENGEIVGFGHAGPGNYEMVGVEGLAQALLGSTRQAAAQAGITKSQIAGAGFGIAGYDWPSEREITLQAIAALGLTCPLSVHNDAVLGLAAGAKAGWGVNISGGTSNNCYGRDASGNQGRITGAGMIFGEFGGALEIVVKAVQSVNYAWIRRGPQTALSQKFMELTHTSTPAHAMEELATGRVEINPAWAPEVFAVAAAGDPIAVEVITWAGTELGELACAVIRQIGVKDEAFDLVLSGSLFKMGDMLIDPVVETVHALAPGAHAIPLDVPQVAGAVFLGMEAAEVLYQEIFEILKSNLKQATN